MKKETIGKQVAQTAQNDDKIYLDDIIDQETKRYWDTIMPYVDEGIKRADGNFFIEVCIKKEKLLPTLAPRILPILRSTCPTPNYDQDVYFYNLKDKALHFVWSLPDREYAIELYTNPLLVPPEEKDILQMVLDWADGTLFRIMKQFNNEKMESNELDKN